MKRLSIIALIILSFTTLVTGCVDELEESFDKKGDELEKSLDKKGDEFEKLIDKKGDELEKSIENVFD